MGRYQFEVPPAGDNDAQLAGDLRAAVIRATFEHKMTFMCHDGSTLAAVVPVGVAIALEPGSVQLGTDTCWTELPSQVRCPAGHRIEQISFTNDRPVALHSDATVCTHTEATALAS